MTFRRTGIPILAVAACLILSPAAVGGQETESAERAVREVVEAFGSALGAGDSTTVIHLLHPDVRIYEGGHAETRAQYRSGHLRGDISFLQAVESETTFDQVVIAGDMALYMSEDRKTGTVRGREIDSRGTETLVLVRTPDGWRIRHIHWSSR